MAKKLKKLPARPHRSYPWEQWLDGSAWALYPDDYPNTTLQGIRVTAYGAAKRYGARLDMVTTYEDHDGDQGVPVLNIQARYEH